MAANQVSKKADKVRAGQEPADKQRYKELMAANEGFTFKAVTRAMNITRATLYEMIESLQTGIWDHGDRFWMSFQEYDNEARWRINDPRLAWGRTWAHIFWTYDRTHNGTDNGLPILPSIIDKVVDQICRDALTEMKKHKVLWLQTGRSPIIRRYYDYSIRPTFRPKSPKKPRKPQSFDKCSVSLEPLSGDDGRHNLEGITAFEKRVKLEARAQGPRVPDEKKLQKLSQKDRLRFQRLRDTRDEPPVFPVPFFRMSTEVKGVKLEPGDLTLQPLKDQVRASLGLDGDGDDVRLFVRDEQNVRELDSDRDLVTIAVEMVKKISDNTQRVHGGIYYAKR